MRNELRKLLVCYAIKFIQWVCPDGGFKRFFDRFVIEHLGKL